VAGRDDDGTSECERISRSRSRPSS
jgi:hypothetical protein